MTIFRAVAGAILGCFALLPVAANAQTALSDGAVARATSDPTTDLWVLYTDAEFSTTPHRGFAKSNRFTLEFQPTLPVALTSGWRLLNYPELVLATAGTATGTQITGIESFSYLAALSPVSRDLGFAWGVGPYLSMPASTDPRLAASQWQIGGGGVLGWRAPKFLAATIVKSGWTTSAAGEPAGTLQAQYTAQYFFDNGSQVGIGRPVIEYSWNRGGGGWTIPVGIDVARVFHVGPLPVKVMLEYDFTALNESRWQPAHTFRVTITPVFRSPFPGPLLD